MVHNAGLMKAMIRMRIIGASGTGIDYNCVKYKYVIYDDLRYR